MDRDQRRGEGRRGKKRSRADRSAPQKERRSRSSSRGSRRRDAKASKSQSRSKNAPESSSNATSNKRNKHRDVSEPSLTPNAVESMILCKESSRFSEIHESASIPIKSESDIAPIDKQATIVRLFFDDPTTDSDENLRHSNNPEDLAALKGIISDGQCYLPVVVLNTDSTLPLLLSYRQDQYNDFVVSVQGFIATDNYGAVFRAFKKKIPPFVSLASVTILRRAKTNHAPFDLGRTWLEVLSDKLPRPATTKTSADKSRNDKNYNSKDDANRASPSKQQQQTAQTVSPRVQGGDAGTLLQQWAPFLTNEALAGGSAVMSSCTSIELDTYEDQVSRVANFLAQHAAMMTLKSAAAVSASSSGRNTPVSISAPETADTGENDTTDSTLSHNTEASGLAATDTEASNKKSSCTPTENTVHNYNAALKEFSASQFDRQRASLVTNSGRETADRAEMVIERYREALECSLNDDEATSLTLPLICSWHSKLLQGLHANAGKIRSKNVRAGHTFFTPPDKIQSELEALFKSLDSLQSRLAMPRSSSSSGRSASSPKNEDRQSKDAAIQALTYVAAAMFGCVDAHPFSDGNGRLCRIVANWALKRVANVPFPINLFATPAQRAEFVTAVQQTRCNFSLRAQGAASRDEILKAFQCTGAFLPLVRLLVDRLARAVDECLRVWEEKSGLAAEQDEARIARRAREKAAQGMCLICLEEKPNIATLCCGKAVHLNCIAEWLGGNNSCPACRCEMPKITGRVVRAASDADASIRRPRLFDFEEDDEDTLDTQPAFDEDDDDDDQGSTSSTSSNDDRIRSLASRIQNQIHRQQGFHVADRIGFEIARRMFRSMASSYDDEDEEEDTSGTTEEDETNTTTTTSGEDEEGTTEISTAEEYSTEDVPRRPLPSQDNAVEEETTEEAGTSTETSSTETTEEAPSPPAASASSGQYCVASHCRNRPAADCTNMLCGRCCILTGTYFCPRHNS